VDHGFRIEHEDEGVEAAGRGGHGGLLGECGECFKSGVDETNCIRRPSSR
jgi:hypothetical protein